jgi:hypothetical protein
MLDDEKVPLQIRQRDVMDKIDYNRDHVSFQYWRMVNGRWLRGRGQLRNWVEEF